MNAKYRIAKFITHSGYCSRREAEKLVVAGLVSVNGKVITNCATVISPNSDHLSISGKQLHLIERPRLWLCNKPKGCITTHSDPQGRTTVFSLLPPEMPRVISVGRLDYNTEGLMLLTNSPVLARHLEHPGSQIIRKYKCRVLGQFFQKHIAQLKKGINIDNFQYGSIHCELLNKQGANSWMMLELCEGKNREIRKIMEFLGFQVNRLIRIEYGKFHLNALGKNLIMELYFETFSEYVEAAYGRLR